MRLPWTSLSFLAALLLLTSVSAVTEKDDPTGPPEEVLKPCTTRSSNTGSFFDLNPIRISLPDPTTVKPGKETPTVVSWHARGYDYGANFTINFCGPVVEELHDVVGMDRGYWRNVSAFYTKEGKTYSIGQQKDELVIRGRKLVLNYTDGSPCSSSNMKRALPPSTIDSFRESDNIGSFRGSNSNLISTSNKKVSPWAEAVALSGGDYNTERVASQVDESRKKSTIISLLCERDPLAAKAAVSFVGASPDECTYFFELRSSAACPTVNIETREVGPLAVFGIIAGITFIVYLVGGIVFQRAVMHQRGWRQLPNYVLWAGMVSFMKDMIVIFFSSCTRCFRKRKGYNQIRPENGRGQFPPDDENRIIDQLDEEWDD